MSAAGEVMYLKVQMFICALLFFIYVYGLDGLRNEMLGARCGCRRPQVSPSLLTMLCNALTSLPHKTVSIQYEIKLLSVFSLHLETSLYQWLHISDNCSLLNILMLIFNFLLKGKEQSAARYCTMHLFAFVKIDISENSLFSGIRKVDFYKLDNIGQHFTSWITLLKNSEYSFIVYFILWTC